METCRYHLGRLLRTPAVCRAPRIIVPQRGCSKWATPHHQQGSSSTSSINACVDYWGRLSPTAVTLKDLCDIGLDRHRRREHGVFLHRELRIRMSQRILELQSLPYGLPRRRGIRDVIQWYTNFVQDLEDAPAPETPAQDEDFTNLLTRVFEEHSEVIQAMAFGVQDLMAESGEAYDQMQPQVDAALRRFFISRIGMRFLLQHHIESFRNREGHSGILQLECDPTTIVRKASKDSIRICQSNLGQSPHIIVEESQPGSFTYVPMHLQYMLTEIFKNACRAVVERHGDGGFDDVLPSVRCFVMYGEEDVTFKISDEGGGIARSRMDNIWKFMYSTYKRSPWRTLARSEDRPEAGDSASNPLQRPPRHGVIAGYGVGLSLSRLYAQYFGGDLKIMSVDGFGTDVYLHLSRLGTGCENLPKVVLYSPSMRDSSLLDGSENMQDRLLISADEEAFMRRELLAYRRQASSESATH